MWRKLLNPKPTTQVKVLTGLLVVNQTVWLVFAHVAKKQRQDYQKTNRILHEFGSLLADKVESEAPWVFHDPDIQSYLTNYEFNKITENFDKE